MSGTRKKATDQQVLDAYNEYKNIWKAADSLGMCGQSVLSRLKKLGVDASQNIFTKEDDEYLASRYVLYRDAGQLQVLADEMGRTKQFICRQAKRLGLTDKNCKRAYLRKWDIPQIVAKPIWEDFKKSRFGLNDYCKNRRYNIQSFVDCMRRNFPDEYDAAIASKKPKGTHYQRGRDFEYRVVKDMAKRGYLALRSPASKSPVDVYCIGSGVLIFIQCKLRGAFPVSEWNTFYNFCLSVNAVPVCAENVRGSIVYHLIKGEKDGSKRPQPWADYDPPTLEVSNV